MTKGVDCSGLVQQLYAHYGIQLPRTTYDMIGQGSAVSIDKLQPGDLVFFSASPDGKSPDHVALYAGNGQMLEAPRTGESVRLTSFTQSYYQERFVGARRISGVTNPAGASSWSPTDTNGTAAKLNPQELAAEYGYAYGFLNSNPDLKGLFSQAVAGNWTSDKFTAELKNTKWYKENSASAREALETQSTDPATWNAQMSAMTTQISQLAGKMGAAVPTSKLQSIAKTALMTNMDDAQLQAALAGYIDFTSKGTLGGQAGAFQHTLTQYAQSMGVNLSDSAIKSQAQLIAKGLMTSDDAQEDIRQTAISKYPSYAEQINGGLTMTDIAQPYAQVASQLLEQPASNFTLTNPLISNALNKVDQSGTPTGMSLSDFEGSIRNSPSWLNTDNARSSLMSAGNSVLQSMGMI